MKALLVVALFVGTGAVSAQSPTFTYRAPGVFATGQLGKPRANDRSIYAPGIGFPIRFDPARGESVVLNSQIFPKGDQCRPQNYQMPWTDTFCEERGWSMRLCPTGLGHQGVDIRPVRCANEDSDVLAVEDGTITMVTAHTTVAQVGQGGRRWRYMHMSPGSIRVRVGDVVHKGQVLGRVSNIMKKIPNTSYHLHLDLTGNVLINGKTRNAYLPPYASLVAAYRTSIGLPDAVVNGQLTVDPSHER
jgi:murein DD-endopeptidase MepM/ murein hydrolase activator NlpD